MTELPKQSDTPIVRLATTSATQRSKAKDLAKKLNLEFVELDSVNSGHLLVVTNQRLELRSIGPNAPGPIYTDFAAGALAHRRMYGGGYRNPLGRALGLKPNSRPFLVDATAGLGRDAFIASAWGCRVSMLERSPIIAALLEDGLDRAKSDPDIGDWVRERLLFRQGDSIGLLKTWPRDSRPEVIYLDPMYPQRSKTALVKKEMQAFHQLVGKDEDSGELLDSALACAARRVVVKRSSRAATLCDLQPSYSVEGKTTRFDVYLVD